jgi:geranylgeranyl pyrophosphate synthase
MIDVRKLLEHEKAEVNAALDRLLPSPQSWPERLHRAMTYAVKAGGKRLRPILARRACAVAGGDPSAITEAVCGLELIHTYSLVHDDLPALDNDEMRRGKPTVHAAFDEPTAILVGDALLTEGMRVLATRPEGLEWATRRAEVTAVVAEAVSSRGMVGGQMEDLEATGQVKGEIRDQENRLHRIHAHKTGCLLRASIETGAVLAGIDGERRGSFVRFGEVLGLAFQVADDVLDATASAEALGKSPGKDAQAGKLTYVTLYGLEAARERLARLEDEMLELAAGLEGPEGELAAISRFVARRRG